MLVDAIHLCFKGEVDGCIGTREAGDITTGFALIGDGGGRAKGDGLGAAMIGDGGDIADLGQCALQLYHTKGACGKSFIHKTARIGLYASAAILEIMQNATTIAVKC